MRLINFGPGEIADRLTILALKIQRGKELGKPIEHFEKERNALLPQLPSFPRVMEGLLELGVVNAGIWHGEDELREMRKAKLADGYTAEVAFRLQELNDRRHELVALINVNTGNNNGAEKL